MKQLATELTGSQTGTVAKAKAAYDLPLYQYALRQNRIRRGGEERHSGLATPSAATAQTSTLCSLPLCELTGIPARFDIGFPLPENKGKGDIPGYHCWAEFYAHKTGWIPVDISEAWKAKEKQDYFFGSVDANRVQFSTGRDVTLSPKQARPALNYFVYRNVEIDAKPCDKLDKQFNFEEVKPPGDRASSSPKDRDFVYTRYSP